MTTMLLVGSLKYFESIFYSVTENAWSSACSKGIHNTSYPAFDISKEKIVLFDHKATYMVVTLSLQGILIVTLVLPSVKQHLLADVTSGGKLSRFIKCTHEPTLFPACSLSLRSL